MTDPDQIPPGSHRHLGLRRQKLIDEAVAKTLQIHIDEAVERVKEEHPEAPEDTTLDFRKIFTKFEG